MLVSSNTILIIIVINKEEGIIKRIGNAALNLVYPRDLYCISCGKIIDGSRTYRLCNDCMEAMNWVTDRHCMCCGKPKADTDPGDMCFDCSEREAAGDAHAFDKGYVCAGYGACEQAAIFAMKYGGRSDIGVTLGEIMYDRMCAEFGDGALKERYDLVIPVPIYKEKKKKRGFNHAEVMAGRFASAAGIPCEAGIVVRAKATRPMKGLGREERRANISGAFAIRERGISRIAGARILLIDDIFTTGATVDELAALLKAPAPGSVTGAPRRAARQPRTARPPQAALPGASRVDFLAFAGGKDIIIS